MGDDRADIKRTGGSQFSLFEKMPPVNYSGTCFQVQEQARRVLEPLRGGYGTDTSTITNALILAKKVLNGQQRESELFVHILIAAYFFQPKGNEVDVEQTMCLKSATSRSKYLFTCGCEWEEAIEPIRMCYQTTSDFAFWQTLYLTKYGYSLYPKPGTRIHNFIPSQDGRYFKDIEMYLAMRRMRPQEEQWDFQLLYRFVDVANMIVEAIEYIKRDDPVGDEIISQDRRCNIDWLPKS